MAGQDILVGFLEMLERRGYELTINDFSGLIVSDEAQAQRFAPYNIHRNPFCMMIKSRARLWNECLRKKPALCRAAAERAGLFRGMCFCGREEYVMPVLKDGIVLATIGLGGFSTDRAGGIERAERALEGAGLSAAALVQDPSGRGAPGLSGLYDAACGAPDPGEADALALLGMAAAELRRTYKTLEAAKGRLVIPEAARLSRERRLALHAAEHIRRNITETLGAEQVAAACHVSVSSLSHVFKKNMRMSMKAYQAQLRLGLAKELLLEGASVTEAALESGFEDPNYFSRVFAAAEGMPPSSWLRGPAARRGPDPAEGPRG
jgi:AraC-like DNA-binding protein